MSTSWGHSNYEFECSWCKVTHPKGSLVFSVEPITYPWICVQALRVANSEAHKFWDKYGLKARAETLGTTLP